MRVPSASPNTIIMLKNKYIFVTGSYYNIDGGYLAK
jgi:hypothetical protein